MTDITEEGTVLGTPPENNIVSFTDFKKQKDSGEPTAKWPSAVPVEALISPVKVGKADPAERKVLLCLTHGDIVMNGLLGLSQTFLAVGDTSGNIKFAAAPGMWQYARDITNDPAFEEDPPESA